jgi:hypothetical protein
MQKQTICHCGKCVVTCNKHGKRGNCSDCGKKRLLGTIVEMGIIRHICDECAEIASENQRKQEEEFLRQTLCNEKEWDDNLLIL